MPIEVLTIEEIEKMVEEKLKKLLLDMEISKKIAQLESTIAKLKDDVAKPSIKEAAVAEPEPIAAALTRDLAQLEELLQIGITSTSVTLKPKAYLGAFIGKLRMRNRWLTWLIVRSVEKRSSLARK